MLIVSLIGSLCYAQAESDPQLDGVLQPLTVGVQENAVVYPVDGYIHETVSSNAGTKTGSPTELPADFRFLHKVEVNGAWLAGGGAAGFAMTESSASATVIVPIMMAGSPLIVTPGFDVTSLDTSTTLGLPKQLYRSSANIMWMPKYGDRVDFLIGVAPGVSSDFVATEQVFRLFGFGAANYQWSDTIKLTLGAAYTGRNDYPVFPMAGVTWKPHDDLSVELAIPRPRIARRLHHLPWSRDTGEDWAYIAGELGGGTWAVRRPSGRDDLITLRDFRAVIGFERKAEQGPSGKLEVGYIFWREVEFEDDPATIQPTDTIMIRTGLTF